MAEIVSECLLCGSPSSSAFDRREFRGYPVTNIICRNCGLVYQSPRMTAAERQAFYEDGYRLLYQGQEGPKPEDLAVQEARARLILDFLPDEVRPISVLDIGCSAGKLLHQFHDRFEARVCGVEPGKAYREHAISSGLQVYASLDELKHSDTEPFSLVSMMHVLEHFPDPLLYLQNLRHKLLDPHGWLLIEVPNLYAHDCFEVAHLVSFSPHTLKSLVRSAGYKVVKYHAHGMPRSKIIPLYLTLLAQSVENGNQPQPIFKERSIKLKRELGLFRRSIAERLFPRLAWGGF